MQHATTTHPATDSYELDAGVWSRVRNILFILMAAGWALSLVGLLIDRPQFFRSYLVGFTFFTTIALGALFFVMIQYLTGSAWSVPIRRFMETIMMTLPIGALLFIPIAFGLHDIYEWAHEGIMERDPILRLKAGYLNPTWFLIRAAVYFVIWGIWSYNIYKHSTAQDKTGSLERMHSISRWSAPGLLFIFLSVTLAMFDWIMSLNPHWYSTIFGIYCYAGGGLSFMATLILISLGLRRAGVLTNTITVEHYHDLGKWCFALTVFWAYIAFSQYMLIWYANLPEETIFYKMRMEGSWLNLSLLLIVGRFAVPFAVLLPRANKRNFKVLAFAACWILLFHFVDHYWLIAPNFQHEGPRGVHLHWLDVTTWLAVGATYAFAFWTQLRKHPILPVGDPRFEQGLHFQNT